MIPADLPTDREEEGYPCYGGPFDGARVPFLNFPPPLWCFPFGVVVPRLMLREANLTPDVPPVSHYAVYRRVGDPSGVRYVYERTE